MVEDDVKPRKIKSSALSKSEIIKLARDVKDRVTTGLKSNPSANDDDSEVFVCIISKVAQTVAPLIEKEKLLP